MRYSETRPAADLTPYVQCIWELESGGAGLLEPIFPDGRMEIVVHLGDRPIAAHQATPQPEIMAVGQMTAAVRLSAVPRLHAVGIRFTPAGARAWLELPAYELTDHFQPLDDLNGTASRQLLAAVHDGKTSQGRVARIEQALRATIRSRRRSPASIEHAIGVTQARYGRIAINALANECGVSARQLERQFLSAVGLSPKAFARTVRFQRALEYLRQGRPAAVAAVECGFADQAHLAREFRRFAGVAATSVDFTNVAFLQDGRPVSDAS